MLGSVKLRFGRDDGGIIGVVLTVNDDRNFICPLAVLSFIE